MHYGMCWNLVKRTANTMSLMKKVVKLWNVQKNLLWHCSVHARFLQQGMRKPDMLPLLHCPEILYYLMCGVKCSFRSTIQKKIYLCSHTYSFRWMGTGQTGISVRLHVRKLHKKSVMDETSFVHNVKVFMKLNVNTAEYSSFSLSEPEYGLLPSTFSRERNMFWCLVHNN